MEPPVATLPHSPRGFACRARLEESRQGRANGASLALATTPSGDGKIALQARGENLGAATIPLALPVRAQLQGAHGVCWETHVTAASVQRNDGGKFSARDAL